MHIHRIRLDIQHYPTREYYPFNLPLFQQQEEILFKTPVTFFIGENGSGKTTLLKAIALRSGIQIWRDTETRRFTRNPYENKLQNYIQVDWTRKRVPGIFFGSNYFQFFSEILDDWAISDPGQLKYFGGNSLLSLSHGESILSYFRKVFQIEGVFFLDEPETALSPKSQVELLNDLLERSGDDDAQFFIATHSPILLACPRSTIYCFDGNRLEEIKYTETEYYRTYHQFMNHPEDYIRRPEENR